MTKKQEEQPKAGAGNVALIVSFAVCLALGGLVWWLKGRAEETRRRLDVSIEQYDQMKQLKPKVMELRDRVPQAGSQQIDPSQIATFLASKASQVGLPNPSLKSGTAKSGGWVEFETTVDLRAPGRDASIARGPFVDFLAAVERERPYLKSKGLVMTFSNGPDLSYASARISYFKRE